MSIPVSRRDFSTAAVAGRGSGTCSVPRIWVRRPCDRGQRPRAARLYRRGISRRTGPLRFRRHTDAEIVALSDVYEPYLNGQFDKIHPHFKELTYLVPSKMPDFGGPVERHKDFRRILDKKEIDAVIIATPDHWHAVQTIMACDAGKDVYIEKPCSLTVREGRAWSGGRRNERVVQVGTQRRSSKLYAQLAEMVHRARSARSQWPGPV